jgi:hypothetical protein
MVKLPCAILALEKINELKDKGITPETTMFTDSLTACEKKVIADTSSFKKLPSIEHYIKKMLLVSDNLAYGRTYEFLTPDYIHTRLKKLNFPSIRIVHRFDGGCSGIRNVTSNQIRFIDEKGTLLFQQNQSVAKLNYTNPLGSVKVGTAHINNKGKKINEPKDFTNLNVMYLWDVHRILQRLVFMPQLKEVDKYSISKENRNFLLKYLCMLPRESYYPKYDAKKYFDSYKKYLIYGDSKKSINNNNVRIFNIVGQSFGFMADCAYIVDFKTNTEFMLSVVIYANETDIINSGKYEYNNVALPFLSQLGKSFLKYEQQRKKINSPNLGEFKFFDEH